MTRQTPAMNTRVDLREAIEKEVLSYLLALQYDKKKNKMAEERNTTFTPLPNENFNRTDPAASSMMALVDYDPSDPQSQTGHAIIPDVPSNYEQTFDALYDLSKMHLPELGQGWGAPQGGLNFSGL